MTLPQFLVSKHFAHSTDATKCFCPFHRNRVTEAAYLNTNSIYCFVCNRSYTLKDFWNEFHVRLEYQEETGNSHVLKSINGIDDLYPNSVLFSYRWSEENPTIVLR